MTKSVGLQSDHIFDRYNGIIEEELLYTCVHHPDNPHYFFGNYLLLKNGSYDKEQMEDDFDKLLGSKADYNHKCFQWLKGDVYVDINDFISAGYKHMDCKVLTMDQTDFIPTTKSNKEIEIRKLKSDDDWEMWFNLELSIREEDEPLAPFKKFVHGRSRMYRSMINDGLGCWFGAFINEQLVGSVGFFYEDGLGRFQSVITHEDYRGKNICKTLVTHACRYGLTKVSKLVMFADTDYHAAKIYEGLGFKCVEEISSVYWWKK
jgi:ribosomal protein S18 acetylase RimI-like enzyme